MQRVIFHGLVRDHWVFSTISIENSWCENLPEGTITFRRDYPSDDQQLAMVNLIDWHYMLSNVVAIPAECLGKYCLVKGNSWIRLFYQKSMWQLPPGATNGWEDHLKDSIALSISDKLNGLFHNSFKLSLIDFQPTRDWRPAKIEDF